MDITESLFKELASPLCQNKNKKPKKYSNSYYEPFIKYINIHNFGKKINENNFEKYFLEFCRFYFEDENGYRLDFSEKIKLDLLKRSGGCCAICGTLTIFPLQNDACSALNLGAACHIRPASAYGPRSDVKYRDSHLKEIVSIENGIWACLNCHKEIDQDFRTYTVENLLRLKDEHEKIILDIKNKQINIRKLIERIRILDDFEFVHINREVYERNQETLSLMYQELKEIEKKSIDNISIFKAIQQLKLKKDRDLGLNACLKIKLHKDYDWSATGIINMEKEKLIELMKEDHEWFKRRDLYFDGEEKEAIMALDIQDINEEVEVFIVNNKKDKIIKVNNFDINFQELEEDAVRIIIMNNRKDYIDIDPIKKYYLFSNKKSFKIYFVKKLSFLKFISGFEIEDSILIIKYKDKSFVIPSNILFKNDNCDFYGLEAKISGDYN